MKKILVIPDHNYTFHSLGINKNPLKKLQQWKHYYNFKQVTYESLYYSALLSTDNFQITFLGNLHPEYQKFPVPEYSTNPSAYHANIHEFIREKELREKHAQFDILLLSYNVLKINPNLWIHKQFRKHNKFVAILDFPEDEITMQEPNEENIFRGLRPQRDFDIYFKNIIPRGFSMDNLYPIGPTPVRLENFDLSNLKPIRERDYSVYFSGILNKSETFKNRNELINSLSKLRYSNIHSIDLNNHYKNNLPSNNLYLEQLSNSKISFSPAGRAWTTTRHFISAIHECAVLLPEPDCELLDYTQTDGENCISYPMIDRLNETQVNKEISKIIEKINYYTKHLSILEAISKNYKEQIINYHQVKHRGEFILKTIEKHV